MRLVNIEILFFSSIFLSIGAFDNDTRSIVGFQHLLGFLAHTSVIWQNSAKINMMNTVRIGLLVAARKQIITGKNYC